jgi:hypothetical protein
MASNVNFRPGDTPGNRPILRPQCIISGGQTGADQAALLAAKSLGIPTTGYAPHGWRTEKGPAPWLETLYGLMEHPDGDYLSRTEENVRMSDGTVIFGNRSRGSNRTEEFCRVIGKPCLWLKEYQNGTSHTQFRIWMNNHRIKVLNVAGNRESRSPGIGAAVERFLMEAFS